MKTLFSILFGAYIVFFKSIFSRNRVKRNFSLRHMTRAIAFAAQMLPEFGTQIREGYWIVLQPEHGGTPRNFGELLESNYGAMFYEEKPKTKLVVVRRKHE